VDDEGTTTYTYDALHRLTEVTYPDGSTTSYEYDPMGNRTSMTENGVTTTYTYDATDRLLSAGSITFTWDNNGNMLNKGAMSFTYDGANRLTQVISGTTTVEFAYDGDGRRTSKTVNGTATNYVYDTIAGLAYVLVEETGGSNTLYTYGADLIAMTDPGGTQQYYHYDGLGSTRNLTNGSGQEIASYSYDVFGGIRSMTGSPTNDFTFAGEQVDDETGLIYLRARYYDPEIGRFLSRDSFPGFAGTTQSLNRYAYAGNNPVNLVDPSGELAFGSLLIVAGLLALGAYIGAMMDPPQVGEQAPPNENRRVLRNAVIDIAAGAITQPIKKGRALVSATVAGAKSIAKDISNNQPVDLRKAIAEAAIAGVTEAIVGKALYRADRPWYEVPGAKPRSLWAQLTGKHAQHEVQEHLARELLKWELRSLTDLTKDWLKTQLLKPAQSTLPSVQSLHPSTSRAELAGGGSGFGVGATVGNYVRFIDVLRQAGFNAANPQAPPSGSK